MTVGPKVRWSTAAERYERMMKMREKKEARRASFHKSNVMPEEPMMTLPGHAAPAIHIKYSLLKEHKMLKQPIDGQCNLYPVAGLGKCNFTTTTKCAICNMFFCNFTSTNNRYCYYRHVEWCHLNERLYDDATPQNVIEHERPKSDDGDDDIVQDTANCSEDHEIFNFHQHTIDQDNEDD